MRRILTVALALTGLVALALLQAPRLATRFTQQQPLQSQGSRRLQGNTSQELRPLGIFPWGRDPSSPLRMERFQEPLRLGSGTWGEAWRAWDSVLRRPVALKLLFKGKRGKAYVTKRDLRVDDALRVNSTSQECGSWVRRGGTFPAGRQHVCTCLESHMEDQVRGDDVGFLVLELCGGTNLQQLLLRQMEAPVGKEEWQRRVRGWMGGLLRGLHFLSSLYPPMMHMDLKLENVVEDGGVVKIIDFGRAQDYSRPVLRARTKAPPEVYANAAMGKTTHFEGKRAWSFDVWSFGSIYYNLLCSTPRNKAQSFAKAAAEFLVGRRDVPEGTLPSSCKDGTPGYGSSEDWRVIKAALALLKHRKSPAELLEMMPGTE